MAKRGVYVGVLDADRRFDSLRGGVDRLRALELAQVTPSPAALALDHAVVAVRVAANMLTGRLEFFELQRRGDQGAHARAVAELEALRPMVLELRSMADAYHPAAPECRSLRHAVDAVRMAADVLSGRSDFYGMVAKDAGQVGGSSAARDGFVLDPFTSTPGCKLGRLA